MDAATQCELAGLKREVARLSLMLFEAQQERDIMRRIATAQNKRANGLRRQLRRVAPQIVLAEDVAC